jgi:hypothetical protein
VGRWGPLLSTTLYAFGVALVLGLRFDVWVPLWATCVLFVACASETARTRWARARWHRKSMRAWRDGKITW